MMKGTIIPKTKTTLTDEERKVLGIVLTIPRDTTFTSKNAEFGELTEIQRIRGLSNLRGMDLIDEVKTESKQFHEDTDSFTTKHNKFYILQSGSYIEERANTVYSNGLSYMTRHYGVSGYWPFRPIEKFTSEARITEDGKINWIGVPDLDDFKGKYVTITVTRQG